MIIKGRMTVKGGNYTSIKDFHLKGCVIGKKIKTRLQEAINTNLAMSVRSGPNMQWFPVRLSLLGLSQVLNAWPKSNSPESHQTPGQENNY